MGMRLAVKTHPYIIFLLAFVSGIALRCFSEVSVPLMIVCAAAAAAAALSALLARSVRGAVIALALIGLLAGIVRTDLALVLHIPPEAEAALGQSADIEGVVSGEPTRTDTATQIRIRVDTIDGTHMRDAAMVLVYADLYARVSYSDRVRVSGVLQEPEDFQDPATGRMVPYQRMLLKDGVDLIMRYPSIEIIGTGQGNPVLAALFATKERFVGAIGRVVPEPAATLGEGLIVGGTGASPALATEFRRVGISHIVAVSGFNLTIIARAVESALVFLPRTVALGSSAGLIVLFALGVGGGATVVRAAAMALVALAAKKLRRVYSVERALALAAGAMLLQDPLILAYDVSFQLSFVATLSLIYVVPIVEPHFSWLTERGGLRDIVATTLAAEITVLPLMLASFGNFSVVGLVANALILPFVPLAMLLVFATGVIGMMWLPTALPFAYLAYAVLAWMLFVTHALAALPFASFTVLISWPIAAVMYGVLISGVIYAWQKKDSLK